MTDQRRRQELWALRLARVGMLLFAPIALILWRLQMLPDDIAGEIVRGLQSGREVHAEVMGAELDFWRGQLIARDIRVADHGRRLARVQELRARPRLFALLRGRLELSAVELSGVELDLNATDLRRLERTAQKPRLWLESLKVFGARVVVAPEAVGRIALADANIELSVVNDVVQVSIDGSDGHFDGHGIALAAPHTQIKTELRRPRLAWLESGRVRLEDARIVVSDAHATALNRTFAEPLELTWSSDARRTGVELRLVTPGLSAASRARIEAGSVTLDDLRITLPSATLEGRAQLDREHLRALALDASDLDVSQLAQLALVPLAGRGRVALRAQGKWSELIGELDLELEAAAIGGVQLGRLQAQLRNAGDTELQVVRAEITGPDRQLSTESASFALASGVSAANVRLRVRKLPLSALYSALGADKDPALARLQGQADGSLELSYARTATGSALDLGLSLGLVEPNLGGYRFDRGKVQARVAIPPGSAGLASAGVVTLNDLSLNAGRGSLAITGEMKRGELAMQIAMRDLPVERAPWLPAQDSPVTGRLRGKGSLNGPTTRTRADLSLALEDLRVLGRALGPLQLRSQLRAAGERTAAAAAPACERAQAALASGAVATGPHASAWLICGDGLHGQLRVDLALGTSDERPVRGQVDFEHLALAAFMPPELATVAAPGLLTGSLAITQGGLGDPRRVSARLHVNKLELGSGEFALANSAPFELQVNAGALALTNAELLGPKLKVALSAAGTLAEAGRLIADADVKANLFTPADQPLVAYYGTIPAHVEWQPGAQPALRGRADLRQLTLQFGSNVALHAQRGALVLADQRLRVEHLTSEFGGGQLELDGEIALRGLRAASYNLSLNAQRVAIEPEPLVRVQFDAATRVSRGATEALPKLSGQIKLKQASYGKQFNVNALTARRSGGGGHAGADRLLLDLSVEHEQPLRVRNSLVDGELTIAGSERKLRLVGSDQHLGLIGKLEVARGRLLFQGDQFHVTRGNLAFNDAHRIAPNFELHAVADQPRRPNTSVVLDAAGTRDAFKIAVSCDNPAVAEAPPPFRCDYAHDRMRCDSMEQLVALWVCRSRVALSAQ